MVHVLDSNRVFILLSREWSTSTLATLDIVKPGITCTSPFFIGPCPFAIASYIHTLQENTLHGRAAAGQINGKGNALAAIAAGNGAGGGAVGGAGVGVGVGLGGRTEDIADLNKLICDRKWDHEQVIFGRDFFFSFALHGLLWELVLHVLS